MCWVEERVLGPLHDQRWGLDLRQQVADVSAVVDLLHDPGHDWRCPQVAGPVEPRAEGRVVSDARGRDGKDVIAQVEGIGIGRQPNALVDQALGHAEGIVGRPQGASGAVDDHQARHPFGVHGRQQEAFGTIDEGGDHHRPIGADGVQHRHSVLRPLLEGGWRGRRPALGQPHSPPIEADEPAERRQPPLEPGHRRLLVDALDGDDGPGKEEEVERTAPQHLVGDVRIATGGVAGPCRGCHHRRVPAVPHRRLGASRPQSVVGSYSMDNEFTQ